MTVQRVIKRYSNRKLYDTRSSRYITLLELAVLLNGEEEVVIIDKASGEDITARTLAQVLLEKEKNKDGNLSLGVLRGILRFSGEALQKRIDDTVAHFKDDAGKRVSFLKEGAERRVAEIRQDAMKIGTRVGLKRWIETLNKVDELEKRLEDLEKKLSETTSHQ